MTLKNARNYKWLEFIKLLAKITRTKRYIGMTKYKIRDLKEDIHDLKLTIKQQPLQVLL